MLTSHQKCKEAILFGQESQEASGQMQHSSATSLFKTSHHDSRPSQISLPPICSTTSTRRQRSHLAWPRSPRIIWPDAAYFLTSFFNSVCDQWHGVKRDYLICICICLTTNSGVISTYVFAAYRLTSHRHPV